uniref:very-long-chain (3R)-3-hydroxyacyl-CoA dehydratase n=1 Tax=Oryza glaberrima TaxID=4538 RepID=I1NK94_ORYGL
MARQHSRISWLQEGDADLYTLLSPACDVPSTAQLHPTTRTQRSRMTIREPLRRGFDTVVTLVAWTIWKECKGRVFNQQQRTWVDIVKGMVAETALWRQANSAIPALILRRDFGSQNRPYSTFIVCFPVGMVCEVVLIYIALPFMEMKALQYQASEKSDKWSFSFNYFYANLFFMASFATATAQVATVSSANK